MSRASGIRGTLEVGGLRVRLSEGWALVGPPSGDHGAGICVWSLRGSIPPDELVHLDLHLVHMGSFGEVLARAVVESTDGSPTQNSVLPPDVDGFAANLVAVQRSSGSVCSAAIYPGPQGQQLVVVCRHSKSPHIREALRRLFRLWTWDRAVDVSTI